MFDIAPRFLGIAFTILCLSLKAALESKYCNISPFFQMVGCYCCCAYMRSAPPYTLKSHTRGILKNAVYKIVQNTTKYYKIRDSRPCNGCARGGGRDGGGVRRRSYVQARLAHGCCIMYTRISCCVWSKVDRERRTQVRHACEWRTGQLSW